MIGTFIIIAVMVITVLLGRYAIAEGHRVEKQKKFMKDMENFDSSKFKLKK